MPKENWQNEGIFLLNEMKKRENFGYFEINFVRFTPKGINNSICFGDDFYGFFLLILHFSPPFIHSGAVSNKRIRTLEEIYYFLGRARYAEKK